LKAVHYISGSLTFFELDPNFGLVNTMQPKPETACEKNDSMDDFCSC